MTNRMRKRRATLRAWRDFLAGSLIGITVQTPVFAATRFDFPTDWTERLTHGDPMAIGVTGGIVVAIAAIAVALGSLSRRRATKAPPPDPENSIGRYRPFHQ